MPFFPSLYTWLLFHAVFPYRHIWILFHAVFPFFSYMAFVSRRFSLPFKHGFCFMPFFPSHHTWLLFHAIFLHLHVWLLFHAVFPFPSYLAFVLYRFFLPVIYAFYFMPFFPTYLN